MVVIGAFLGVLFGLVEALWMGGGSAAWSGLGVALLVILLLDALVGAAAALLFSLLWRRTRLHARLSRGHEVSVFALLLGSALLLVDVNRSMPAGAFEPRSLLVDAAIALCVALILAGLLFVSRGARRLDSLPYPRTGVRLAAVCAGLLLAATGVNAWVESGKGSPIAHAAIVPPGLAWEVPAEEELQATAPPEPSTHPAHPKMVFIGLGWRAG